MPCISLSHFDMYRDQVIAWFDDLPDLSMKFDFLFDLRVENNRLTFEDIEPNINVAIQTFTYSPQEKVGTAQTYTLNIGDPYIFDDVCQTNRISAPVVP